MIGRTNLGSGGGKIIKTNVGRVDFKTTGSKTFDIKPLIPDWNKLTVDNFPIGVCSIAAQWGGQSASVNIDSINYNSTTGMLTVNCRSTSYAGGTMFTAWIDIDCIYLG